MKKAFLSILAVSFLSACLGRTPQPITTFRVSDDVASCAQIRSELISHQQTLIDLQRERSRIGRYNVKVGMWTFFPVFFFIPIHLVFINTTDAPEVEQYAIGGRMNVLNDLKERKGCK